MSKAMITGVATGFFVIFSIQAAHGQSGEIGVDALVARLGAANTPNGTGIVVGQVEAPDSGAYGPNQTENEFVGKTFIAQSGRPGNSGHATLVGQNMYGLASGMAPGITTIYLWEAANWVQAGFLNMNQGSVLPLNPPGGLKIFNNSWIGSFGNVNTDNTALRRADFVVHRDHLIVVNGVNNEGFGGQQPLMCHMFNGLAVGLSNGAHVSGGTLAAYDGAGRMKPEIVAPSQFTSFAAPYVDAVAARLVQTARTFPGLSANANAERSETIKAAILAGANHRENWSNNPATSGPTRGVTMTPLDPIYGADVVNVNNGHLILTGLEQDGANAVPVTVNIRRRGWDVSAILNNGSRYYRFRISAIADVVSIVATWNRLVDSDFLNWTMADFNLTLHRVDVSGQLVSLVGNAGLPYFSGGNVISQSAVDNVEHLFIKNLQPGEYIVQVGRVDTLGSSRTMSLTWLLPLKPGDANEDGSTNVNDLLAVINSWGACPNPCLPACPTDFNGDCVVNVNDLLTVINNWG